MVVAEGVTTDPSLQIAIAVAVMCRLKGWNTAAHKWLGTVRKIAPTPHNPDMAKFLRGAATWPEQDVALPAYGRAAIAAAAGLAAPASEQAGSFRDL